MSNMESYSTVQPTAGIHQQLTDSVLKILQAANSVPLPKLQTLFSKHPPCVLMEWVIFKSQPETDLKMYL